MEALCPFGRPFPLQAPRLAARAPGSPILNESGEKSDQPRSQAGAPATVSWSTFRWPRSARIAIARGRIVRGGGGGDDKPRLASLKQPLQPALRRVFV